MTSVRTLFPMALVVGVSSLVLVACSTTPPGPNWQIEAKSALERANSAYLEGEDRITQAELRHARAALGRTGQPQQLAQAELLHCAARVAALDFTPCAAFEALAIDASEAQQVYARYLGGQHLSTQQIDLLPPAQRPVALRTGQDATPLPASMDPLAMLVAAGTLLQRAQCPPAIVDQAIATASSQGWRRALLAWLAVGIQLARDAGQMELAQRLERRRALALGPTQTP